MVDALTLGAYAQIASGLLIFLLGLALLAVKPRRSYTVAFGLFLGAWGGLIVFGNLATLALAEGAGGTAKRWILFHLAFLTVAYLPLALFAVRFPSGDRPSIGLGFGLALAAPAIAGAVLLNLEPSLLHAGFIGEGASAFSDWGPAYPFYSALFSLTLYAVILRVDHHRRGARSLTDRRRSAYVLAAFLLYTLFETSENLVLFGSGLLETGLDAPATSLVFASLSLAGLAIGAYVAASLVREPDRAIPLSSGWLAGVLAAPVVFGLLSGASRTLSGWPPLLTLGAWRLAAVALIVYALLRFELFGVRRRAADWTAAIGGIGLAVAATVSVDLMLIDLTGSTMAASLLAYGLLLVAVGIVIRYQPRPFDRLIEALSQRPIPVESSPRALEVYEAELARTGSPRDLGSGSALEHLSQRLKIRDAEHAALERLVREDTLAPLNPIEPGTVLQGRYRLGSRLGEGAAAVVHEAKDEVAGQAVAVKLLDPGRAPVETATRRFLREARIARGLDHPNVISVLDSGFHAGRPFLVLELAGGGSIEDILEHQAPFELDSAVRIADGILAGLAHLHGRGLVHGDLTPSNVLLTARGVPQIADLGTARRFEPSRTQELELAPPRAGTPLYMAPETVEGRPPTRRTDLYAVGAILHEMLTGEHYLGLDDPDRERLHRAVRTGAREPGSGLPAGLEGLLDRALAKRPGDRFTSAGEMRDALQKVDPTSSSGIEQAGEKRTPKRGERGSRP